MRRFSRFHWGIVAVVCLNWGCQTAPKAVPLASKSAPSATQADETDDSSDTRNPFQTADDEIPEEALVAEADRQKSGPSPAPDPIGERRQASKGKTHDLETLKLIEDELAHSPPAEREELFEEWKALDPAVVRQIVRIRRMWRQQNQREGRSSAVAQTAPSHSESAIQPTGHTDRNRDGLGAREIAPDPRRGSADPSGLGMANPWNQPNPSASRTSDNSRNAPIQMVGIDEGPPHRMPTERQFGHDSYPTPAGAVTADYDQSDRAERTAFDRRQAASGEQPDPWGTGQMPVSHIPWDGDAPNPQRTQQQFPNRYEDDRSQRSSEPAAVANTMGVQTVSTPPRNRTGDPYSEQQSPGNLFAANDPKQPSNLGQRPTEKRSESPLSRGIQMINGTAALTAQGAFPSLNRQSNNDSSGQHATSPAESAPRDWDSELERLISLAEAETAQLSPGGSEEELRHYLERQVELRLLYLIAGQHSRALEAIPGLDAADQEFWQQMFWSMANYFDFESIPSDADRASQTISQLRSAIQRLQENARLELRNVTFCHKISSYGNYERFNRDEFSPGQPVLVYAEVSNFKSEPTADGMYRTILRSTIEIYKAGAGGDLIHREEFPATEDLCQNYRSDYFHSYEISIPQRTSLGPHIMKLTVEDQLSQKVATYTVNFTVK